MGLIPTFCRALISLHKQLQFTGPVLTLGNQDVWANHEQLKTFFREMECPYAEAPAIPHTSKLFTQIPETEDFVHARTFFEMLGIKEYYDIDKFEIESPQILHDLNAPVPAELHDKFNLIIDSGTIEHIFDVRQVMENMVDMCRRSGWVVHITPASNYIDHGLYSFSPCFFYDFYRANGFDEFTCYIIQINAENFYEPCPYFKYSYGMELHPLIDPNRVIAVFFVAKKVEETKPLVIPTQGIYETERVVEDQESDVPTAVTDEGTRSVIERVVPGPLIPYLKPIRPMLGTVRRTLTQRRRNVIPPYQMLSRL